MHLDFSPGMLTLSSRPPDRGEKTLCCFKPLSLWSSATGAQGAGALWSSNPWVAHSGLLLLLGLSWPGWAGWGLCSICHPLPRTTGCPCVTSFHGGRSTVELAGAGEAFLRPGVRMGTRSRPPVCPWLEPAQGQAESHGAGNTLSKTLGRAWMQEPPNSVPATHRYVHLHLQSHCLQCTGPSLCAGV